MTKTKTKKNQKVLNVANVLETLKDVGKDVRSETVDTMKDQLIKPVAGEFVNQIFGTGKYSGEISAGESLEVRDVFSGKKAEEEQVRKRVHFERHMYQEQQVLVDKKTNELRLQLKAMIEEIQMLAISTSDLAEETQIAAMQVPIEPGIYHLAFFENMLEFIKSFRKKINQAKTWLHSSNARANKKNYWSQYKQHGAKFLLSSEHYVARNAG